MQIQTPALAARVRETLKGAVGRWKNIELSSQFVPSELRGKTPFCNSLFLSAEQQCWHKSCLVTLQVRLAFVFHWALWKPRRTRVCIGEIKRNVFYLSWQFYNELCGYLTSLRPILPPSLTHLCIGVSWVFLLLYLFNAYVESKSNNYIFLSYNSPFHVSPNISSSLFYHICYGIKDISYLTIHYYSSISPIVIVFGNQVNFQKKFWKLSLQRWVFVSSQDMIPAQQQAFKNNYH